MSLSADGNVLVARTSGHIRVFRRISDGNWAQIGQDIIWEIFGDGRGGVLSLSLDGTVLAFGANDAAGVSYVQVVAWSGDAWLPVGGTIECNTAARDISLSSDGTILAIGTPYNIDETGSATGQVRVFYLVPA